MNNPLQHSGDEKGSSSSTEGDQPSGNSMSVSESESEMQHSGDEKGSSSSTEGDQPSGNSMSVSESEPELQHSRDENRLLDSQTPDELESESKLEPESELKAESEPEVESEPKPESEPSQPPSSRATKSGGKNSNFTLENYLFEVQLHPGDVEEGKIALSQTGADHFFAEAGTSCRQPHLLLSDCDKKLWPMKFKDDPPVQCGRLRLIGLKAFVEAHELRPWDLIRFHKPAKPKQINHYLVDCVRIRPRTRPQPAIRIGNDGGDDDDGDGKDDDDDDDDDDDGDDDGDSDGDDDDDDDDDYDYDDGDIRGRKRRYGEPHPSNRNKGKGADCVRRRPGGGGSKRGESGSTGKGKGVITGEKLEICLCEKQLAEKDVVGPSMEKPKSLLQADLCKDFIRCTSIF